MNAIKITRGSRRMGRLLKVGETLVVPEDIAAVTAADLVATDRAVWEKTAARPKGIETQDAPPLRTRAKAAPAKGAGAGRRKTASRK
ncbi:hypothetical protein [Microbaculum marinisediminis]|uniref:Uncharacterized protein n=1 Tax=Microbaculum marinisediminis TaxID=2931392 RepID=A0AAW5QW22_9HYPH|nr:hypothetical protein [Microbaculum sp. A6E488]MCT8970588.1 hypothetical protein [Microbaculum sp. A6E488]